MRKFVTLAAAASTAFGSLASTNIDLNTLASNLSELQEFATTANFEIYLPSSDQPVTYNIRIASSANEEDSLASADYLIEWSSSNNGETANGFSAYFPGHLYRFRDQRLQEYIYEDDPVVFAPGGDINNGIQNQTQFCDLLPQYVGKAFKAMMSDTTYKYNVYPDTIISGQRVVAVNGVRSFQGIEALRFLYIFDRDLFPVKTELINNPEQFGEQTLTVSYDYGDDDPLFVAQSEDDLKALYPEAFEKYRESSFSLDNLPGRKLPAFTAPTTTGERYILTKHGQFAAPTIVAILSSEVESTAKTIKELRRAIDGLPGKTDLIMAFINNDLDGIEEAAGELRPGEHLLMSAKGLARDCGVTATPVIIICDRSAIVKDLLIGNNNDIADFVIKKTSLIDK